MTVEIMPPLMFAGLVVFLLLGFPVAFSLCAVGLGFGLFFIELGFFTPAYLGNLPPRVFGILSNDLLLAIPFFTLMGAILERCGLAEELLESTAQLFGKIPGGIAVAVVLVGALLGAVTGTVAASVLAMGVIALPIMLRHGYDQRLATGVVAASGTITQLIPPSLVLIVLSDQLGRSVGDMYAGAIGPALLQILLFLAFVAGVALVAPHRVPALPPEALMARGWPLYFRVLRGMVPPLLLLFLVLGTILMGLATPTEAGAMGTVGAVALAILNGRFSWKLMREAMGNAMRITAMVIYILIGATVFSLVFQGVDGSHWVEGLLANLPGGQIGFLLFVNAFIFVLGFFLDFFEIAFIVVPLLAPVATTLDIDLVWFGVLLCINLQSSFMTPPFGFALFYIRSIAPKFVSTQAIYRGAIPWICLQLLLVAIVMIWPEAVTFLIQGGTGVDPATVTIDVPPPAPPSDDDAMPIFR